MALLRCEKMILFYLLFTTGCQKPDMHPIGLIRTTQCPIR